MFQIRYTPPLSAEEIDRMQYDIRARREDIYIGDGDTYWPIQGVEENGKLRLGRAWHPFRPLFDRDEQGGLT